MSGLGKGVSASSIGVVLKSCGLRVTSIKIGQEKSLLSFGPLELALELDFAFFHSLLLSF